MYVVIIHYWSYPRQQEKKLKLCGNLLLPKNNYPTE